MYYSYTPPARSLFQLTCPRRLNAKKAHNEVNQNTYSIFTVFSVKNIIAPPARSLFQLTCPRRLNAKKAHNEVNQNTYSIFTVFSIKNIITPTVPVQSADELAAYQGCELVSANHLMRSQSTHRTVRIRQYSVE